MRQEEERDEKSILESHSPEKSICFISLSLRMKWAEAAQDETTETLTQVRVPESASLLILEN